jgi:hypothetical protein
MVFCGGATALESPRKIAVQFSPQHRTKLWGANPEGGMRTLGALVFALIILPQAANAITYYNIAVECKFDIEQYCKDIPKRRIRDLRECLAKHEKDLFPRCQDHYKEAK